jgi:hypothetical protein
MVAGLRAFPISILKVGLAIADWLQYYDRRNAKERTNLVQECLVMTLSLNL